MGNAALSELSLRYKHLPGLKHIARSCDPAQLGVRTCHSKLTTEFTRNQNDHNTSFTAILSNLEFAKHHISVIGITTYPQYLQARSSKRSKRSSKSIKKRLPSLPHNRHKTSLPLKRSTKRSQQGTSAPKHHSPQPGAREPSPCGARGSRSSPGIPTQTPSRSSAGGSAAGKR